MEISGSSVFSSGLSSIQSGQRRVDQAAAEIAGASLPRATSQAQPVLQSPAEARPKDLSNSLVDLQVGKVEAQTGARVLETADAVLGTMLDTRA